MWRIYDEFQGAMTWGRSYIDIVGQLLYLVRSHPSGRIKKGGKVGKGEVGGTFIKVQGPRTFWSGKFSKPFDFIFLISP
jgi:hypothetical protein